MPQPWPGGMSVTGMAPFFSTFGVFAVSEVYNQNRLNDFNPRQCQDSRHPRGAGRGRGWPNAPVH